MTFEKPSTDTWGLGPASAASAGLFRASSIKLTTFTSHAIQGHSLERLPSDSLHGAEAQDPIGPQMPRMHQSPQHRISRVDLGGVLCPICNRSSFQIAF